MKQIAIVQEVHGAEGFVIAASDITSIPDKIFAIPVRELACPVHVDTKIERGDDGLWRAPK